MSGRSADDDAGKTSTMVFVRCRINDNSVNGVWAPEDHVAARADGMRGMLGCRSVVIGKRRVARDEREIAEEYEGMMEARVSR